MKYCKASMNFFEVDWFLNCLNGSSGKKVSFTDDFSESKKGFGGGTCTPTRC